MTRLLVVVTLATALLANRPQLQAQGGRTLTIAAASDLQTVFPELVRRFERETGTKVTVSYGSSGNFFAQIQNGAPFDLYFSADIDYPRQLATKGYGEAGSLYEYGVGRLVLWARKDRGIDVARGLPVLRDARVRRIAIASPQHAPYGRAAVAALRHEKLYDAVQARLVLGENVSQAAQLVDSGNADVGIIALSLALGSALRASGTYVEVSAAAHPPIEQAAVIVSASKNKDSARRFLEYVQQPAAKELLQRSGFEAPR
jgi:molybdate transport system substrate-binding protein